MIVLWIIALFYDKEMNDKIQYTDERIRRNILKRNNAKRLVEKLVFCEGTWLWNMFLCNFAKIPYCQFWQKK